MDKKKITYGNLIGVLREQVVDISTGYTGYSCGDTYIEADITAPTDLEIDFTDAEWEEEPVIVSSSIYEALENIDPSLTER